MTVYRPQEIPRIGELLREQGWLTYAQILAVSEAQKATGERFGETAIRLGFVTHQQLHHALHSQWRLKTAAAVLAAGIAVASPVAAVAGTTAALNLMGYVRPTAAMQIERGNVAIPLDGKGSTSEIEIVEKAPGAYTIEIHARSAAESGGVLALRDPTGRVAVPYELHYGGKPVLLSGAGQGIVTRHAAMTPAAGRTNSLAIVTRPGPGLSGVAGGMSLTDAITLTIRIQ